MGRDMFVGMHWNDRKSADDHMGKVANINSSLTPWNCRPRAGGLRSPKHETDQTATGLKDISLTDHAIASNGHSYDTVFTRNGVKENGYCSPPADNIYSKQRTEMKNRESRQSQYPYDFHQVSPNNFDTQLAAGSFSKGTWSRIETDWKQSEVWKAKDQNPERAKNSSETLNSHSEVPRIVPLKPQRSKKSLNKGNKGVLNPQTQNQAALGAAGNTNVTQMMKSIEGPSEIETRADYITAVQSSTYSIKQNMSATKHYTETTMSLQQRSQCHFSDDQQLRNELSGHQELIDLRDIMGLGQWTGGGMLVHEDHLQNCPDLKNSLLSSSKFSSSQTTPPRTLPLKAQWWRETGIRSRHGSMDISHIHYRIPSQETTKRKQAVNRLPP